MRGTQVRPYEHAQSFGWECREGVLVGGIISEIGDLRARMAAEEVGECSPFVVADGPEFESAVEWQNLHASREPVAQFRPEFL